MEIKENYNLSNLNTFQVNATARFFTDISKEEDLRGLLASPEFRNNPKMFLGGGSNVLFTRDFDGIVVKISLLGKEILEENDETVLLAAGAGENWHDLVTYAVNNNFGGIENLAYIPGTVGAAPVQNIAAYGENFSDVFEYLEALNIDTGNIERFDEARSQFGYRDSIFKRELKGKYIITKVAMRLSKRPKIQDSYYQIGIVRDSVREEMERTATQPFTIKDVYQAVVNIRKRKLPDPKEIPTVGSFFLNSVVTREKYEELKKMVTELQCYPPDHLQYENDPDIEKGDFVKVATGRLLEVLGWLGKWEGNVGVHDRHALVIVTNGKASGEEVVRFAEKIQKSYFDRYGIPLETEVNMI